MVCCHSRCLPHFLSYMCSAAKPSTKKDASSFSAHQSRVQTKATCFFSLITEGRWFDRWPAWQQGLSLSRVWGWGGIKSSLVNTCNQKHHTIRVQSTHRRRQRCQVGRSRARPTELRVLFGRDTQKNSNIFHQIQILWCCTCVPIYCPKYPHIQ